MRATQLRVTEQGEQLVLVLDETGEIRVASVDEFSSRISS